MDERTVADVIAEWRETFAKWQMISEDSANDLAGRINYYIITEVLNERGVD